MPDIDTLISLVYDDVARFGDFQAVRATDLPPSYQSLLAHDDHMTVTVEAIHGSLVDVQVLEVKEDANSYVRKILLKRRDNGEIVQFGIVRLHLDCLDAEVAAQIKSREIPLGRVLIRNNVMRHVELKGLYQIEPGPDLARLLGSDATTFGRTALIHVDGRPAVELLEVVSAVP